MIREYYENGEQSINSYQESVLARLAYGLFLNFDDFTRTSAAFLRVFFPLGQFRPYRM